MSFFSEKKNSFLEIGYDPLSWILCMRTKISCLLIKNRVCLFMEMRLKKEILLINQVLLYLYKKGEYDPSRETSFTPSLCNRLDKNTGGIVIIAKNSESQRLLYDIVKYRKVVKKYLALVHGIFSEKSATLTAFLTKRPSGNIVDVTDFETEGSRRIITKYNVLDEGNNLSLLEIELVTGRTHQIRGLIWRT